MATVTSYSLIINAGSSSVKFALMGMGNLRRRVSGTVEQIGLPSSNAAFHDHGERRVNAKVFHGGIRTHAAAVELILHNLERWRSQIQRIGHRVVHGGGEFIAPVVVTPAVLAKLALLNRLAPLHNPHNLAAIAACHQHWPQIPNVAVFDTAFYRTLPTYASRYPLSEEVVRHGVRKYGFHGISHAHVAEVVTRRKGPGMRLVSCHLGAGVSVTAVRSGQAIDTTMGMTPLGGVMMATRSGDLDPGVVTYLQRTLGLSPTATDELLNQHSGWLAVGGSADLRQILVAAGHRVVGMPATRSYTESERSKARLAINMFTYRVALAIGAMATALGGMDALAFTGATGERSQVVRDQITRRLSAFKPLRVMVVPADEETVIAQQIAKISLSTAKRQGLKKR